MAALVLALEASTEDRLIGDILDAGHSVTARPANAQELVEQLIGSAADALLVSGSPRFLTDEVLQAADRAGIRSVALATDEGDRRNAASLGLYEVIDDTAAWGDIEALLLGDGAARPDAGGRVRGMDAEPASGSAASGPRSPNGTVIAVWGPSGAPGRTSIAIAVAAELAAQGHRVALADADTYGGAVAPALGLLDEAPGFAAACRLTSSGGLTIDELDRIAQGYRAARFSFAVLTGISRPSRWPEVSGERVTSALRVCRSWVNYTVVDCGFSLELDEEISSDLFAPRRNGATIAALREADVVIAVGAADPVGLARFLRAHVELVEIVDNARVEILINRVRGSVVGLNPGAQIGSTLLRFGGIVAPSLVPNDAPAYDAALLSGRTLREAAPRSPAVAAIERFVAATIAAPTAASPERRRRRAPAAVAVR